MWVKSDNVLFVHIPKAAGQAVMTLFYNKYNLKLNKDKAKFLCHRTQFTETVVNLDHLTIREYVRFDYLKAKQWRNAFKFAIVRNPYERLLSAFYMSKRKFEKFTLEQFLSEIDEWFNKEDNFVKQKQKMYELIRPQNEFICDEKGNILVDQLIRYENLQEEIKPIISKYELGKLERVNEGHYKNYEEDLQKKDLIDTVNKYYEKDFKIFNYEVKQ